MTNSFPTSSGAACQFLLPAGWPTDPWPTGAPAGRIVFPEIRQGNPVWFIGRSLHESDDFPRYLGLPRSKPLLDGTPPAATFAVYVSSRVPWIFSRCASGEFRVSALCGTRLHPERLAELGRWTRLYAALDADHRGGLEATAPSLVEAFGHRVIPIRLPQDVKDPADLAPRADGDSIFGAAIRDAVARQVTASREASYRNSESLTRPQQRQPTYGRRARSPTSERRLHALCVHNRPYPGPRAQEPTIARLPGESLAGR